MALSCFALQVPDVRVATRVPGSMLQRDSDKYHTSGGFRNLERGVQPLVHEMRPKHLCCHTHYRSHECNHDMSELSFEVQSDLSSTGD